MSNKTLPTFWQRALAFLVVLLFLITGVVLFLRMELKRETKSGVFHLGTTLAATNGHTTATNLIYGRFTWTDRGVDKFGLPKGGKVAFSGLKGKLPQDTESAILQLKGDISRSKSPKCTDFQGLTLCATIRGKALSGVIIRPSNTLPTPIIPLVVPLIVGLFILFLLSRFYRPSLDALLVLFTTFAMLFWLRIWSNARLLALEQTFHYHGHLSITGWGAIITLALVFAIIFYLLAQHIMDFARELVEKPFVYAAISPAMIGMVVLVFIPFFMGVYIAFLDNNYNFVGLANFREVLFPTAASDTNFYFTLGVTLLWTALNVSLHVIIGLTLALILSDSKLREKVIYRVLLVVPWAVPSYITALVWKWMFNTQYGPINAFIKVIGLPTVDWLGRSFVTNFTANLVTNTWLGFPFMMVVSLGALQSIPAQLYEAAEIDGANRWQRFRHVTLPLLKPALFPAIILGTIWTFNMFNVVYLVSGGAPDNKTNILITEAYRAFRVLKNYGLAAAYSLLIFLILLTYSLITNKLTKGTEDIYA